MKNLRISVKLLLSFAIVAVIAAIVGTVGIIGITSINADYTESYIVQTKPLPDIAKVLEFTQRMRVQLRNLVIYSGNQDHLPHVIAELETRITEYNSFLDNYSSTIVNDEARDRFDTARNAFNNDFMPLLNEVRAGALAGKPVAELSLVLDKTTSIMAAIVDNFSRCMDIKIEAGANSITKNTQSAAIMLTTMIVVMIIAMVAAMLLGIYIAKIIGDPVKRMKTLMDQVGTIGDLEIDPALEAKLADDRKYTDEIGQTVKSFDVLIEHIISVSEALKTISDGDLTENIRTLSDRDVLSVSLLKTQDNLNKMFSEINSSSHQVTTGSVQIADGAQLLAQGATEQSATVEELSASVTEIAQKTKINAGMAGDAKNLAESIKQSAEKGSQQMGQMMQAVREINEASQSIGKVIKIIDDIAFQTNILALNAAVEAARAGQHGKGFAVVADEVRSLAAKSAEAAKNTSELIETSIKKAELGASISEETSESLNQIVEGIVKSSELVAEISHSSDEQAQAIGQISEGIDQVSQVVQQNSATAEQSAAASEEMSGQAMLLQQLIAHFKLKDSSNGHPSAISPSTSVHTRSISAAPASTGYSLSDGGKY